MAALSPHSETAGKYSFAFSFFAPFSTAARSAVFAPLERVKLIVIDEEHEQSYHSDHTPRYGAAEVAQKRAELSGAAVVLGSATPSRMPICISLPST